jgi:hypothetical protein
MVGHVYLSELGHLPRCVTLMLLLRIGLGEACARQREPRTFKETAVPTDKNAEITNASYTGNGNLVSVNVWGTRSECVYLTRQGSNIFKRCVSVRRNGLGENERTNV